MGKTITIFGKEYLVPLHERPAGVSISSPEWIVKMDDLITSTLTGFEEFTEILGFRAESGRFSSGNNPALSAASLRHTELIIVMSNGTYAPKLETRMNSGKPITLIEIVHLGNAGRRLQTIKYGGCRLQSFQQDVKDSLILSFQVSKRTNTIHNYDAEGTATGQDETTVDYTQNKVEG